MALRILFLIIGATIAINIVLSCVGLIMGVNLYKAYGKQILIFFGIFAILIVALYIVLAFLGLLQEG